MQRFETEHKTKVNTILDTCTFCIPSIINTNTLEKGTIKMENEQKEKKIQKSVLQVKSATGQKERCTSPESQNISA